MKALLLFFIHLMMICLGTFSINAKSFHYDPHNQSILSQGELTRTAVTVQEDSLGMTVSYSLGDLTFIESENAPNAYSVYLAGFGRKDVDGYPDVPNRIDLFALPLNVSNVKITLLSSSSSEVHYSLVSTTAPPPYQANESLQPNTLNVTGNMIGSDSIARLHYLSYRAKTPVVAIEVAPVQYNPENQELRIFHTFQYRVDYVFKETAQKTGIIVDMPTEISKPISTTYLIISTPKYTSAITDFIKWKSQCGFNVVTKLKATWTQEAVKETIDSVCEAYDNLKYLLIVGDNDAVPGVNDSFDGWAYNPQWGIRKYITDFPYSCLDGDLTPDIAVGRIPAQDPSQANIALKKIFSYEKNPPTNTNYYSNSLHNAIFTLPDTLEKSQTSEPFVYTSEQAAQYAAIKGINCFRNYSAPTDAYPLYWANRYGRGQEIPFELQKPQFSWDGTINNINRKIEDGTLYVLFNGHGYRTGIRCSSFYPYDYNVDYVKNLTNFKYHPLIFNISCLTGGYMKASTPSLAQSMICSQGGGIGVFAASEYSCMGMSDAMAVGFLNALWPSPGFNYEIDSGWPFPSTPVFKNEPLTLGVMLEKGRQMQIAHYGVTNKFSIYNQRVFHLFGDPSMLIHSVVPQKYQNVSVVVDPISDSILKQLNQNATAEFEGKAKFGNIYVKTNENSKNYICIQDRSGKKSTYYGNNAQLLKAALPVTVTVFGNNRIPYTYTYNPIDSIPSSFPDKYRLYIKNISPNPMTNNAVISVASKDKDTDIHDIYQNIVVQLYSTSGNFEKSFIINKGSSTITINADFLTKGAHIVVLIADGIHMDSKQLIIQ